MPESAQRLFDGLQRFQTMIGIVVAALVFVGFRVEGPTQQLAAIQLRIDKLEEAGKTRQQRLEKLEQRQRMLVALLCLDRTNDRQAQLILDCAATASQASDTITSNQNNNASGSRFPLPDYRSIARYSSSVHWR